MVDRDYIYFRGFMNELGKIFVFWNMWFSRGFRKFLRVKLYGRESFKVF